MSENTTPQETPAIINARDARRSQFVVVDLGTGRAVRAKKMDIASMLFEGLIPMPLLEAAQALVKRKKGGSTFDPEEFDKSGMTTMLRKHACAVCVEPIVVEFDDQNEDHMPVDLFTLMELTAIFNQTAIMPKVAPATAKRFRTRAVSDDPAPVPDGESVRETPKLVDDKPEILSV